MTAATDDSVRLSQERVANANAAAYEIEVSVKAIRMYVAATDGPGEIVPVMRGLEARVAALTSAICRALDPKDEGHDFVMNTVYVYDVARLVNRS